MSDRILEKLEPVRRRQWKLEIARYSATGLLAGSLVALVFGVWRWQTTGQGATGTGAIVTWALAILGAGPILGGLFALIRGVSSRTAATAVDVEYGLKDRAVSAIDFLRRGQRTPMHELQVADAEQHLESLDPRRVAPFRLPAVMPYAATALAVALALLLWPRPTSVQAKPLAPLESILAAADEAEESVEEIAKEAKKENDPKLQELVQKLNETIEQLKMPGVDLKEALAKLSEMQSAIAHEQAELNIGQIDAQMQALGEALASTQALEGAGQALQQGKYEKAAEQLEKAEPKLDRKEAKTLKEKLAQAAKKMEDAGLTDLSTATTELAESLDDDGATAQGACKKLGNLARSQGRRKQINDLLTLSCNSLSECKGNCQKNSTAQLRLKKKSTEPKSTWGMAISGNTDGEHTKLDSARKREQVQGQMGEGESESETTHMPEGRQTASRTYKEQYQKYRRMTEAALNSEPIPLGHRQTIRRYFELIRPQGDEAEKADPKASAQPGASR